VLFTHYGLSCPAILQASNHWRAGESLTIDWAPDGDLLAELRERRTGGEARTLANVLSERLPRRLVERLLDGATAARPFEGRYAVRRAEADHRAVALNNSFGEDVQFYHVEGASSSVEGSVPSGQLPEADCRDQVSDQGLSTPV